MNDKTMTLEQVRDWHEKSAADCKQTADSYPESEEYGSQYRDLQLEHEAMADAITRHLTHPAECGEAVELEYPEFHAEGMGCGLEDRGITDRYEAMRYGFDEALDQMARIIENAWPLYTTPPPAAGVPDVSPRHPVVVHWRNDALKSAAEIVDRYAKHFPECTGAADDIRAMLSATPSPTIDVAVCGACFDTGEVTDQNGNKHKCYYGCAIGDAK